MACQAVHHGAQWRDSSPAHPWVIEASSLPTPTQPWLIESGRPWASHPRQSSGYWGREYTHPRPSSANWGKESTHPDHPRMIEVGSLPTQTILDDWGWESTHHKPSSGDWGQESTHPDHPRVTEARSLPTTNHPRVTEVRSLPTQTILGWLRSGVYPPRPSSGDWGQGAVSIRKTVLPGMAIPMLKIRRPSYL